MQCTACGGGLEYAPSGQAARCLRCQQLFQVEGGHVTPLQVEAPGGGSDPAFTAIFAQQLGFGPPGSNPTAPPGGSAGSSIPDVGVRVHIPGMTSFDVGTKGVSVDGGRLQRNVEKKIKDKISGFFFGLAILGVMLVVVLGVGLYVWLSWDKKPDAGSATAAKWDGKSTYECMNGNVKLEGVTANAGVKASGNCVLALVNVKITAPVAVDASGNAKVTVTGGSLSGTTNAVVADGNAHVTVVGAAVSGKAKTSANGKVVGVPTK